MHHVLEVNVFTIAHWYFFFYFNFIFFPQHPVSGRQWCTVYSNSNRTVTICLNKALLRCHPLVSETVGFLISESWNPFFELQQFAMWKGHNFWQWLFNVTRYNFDRYYMSEAESCFSTEFPHVKISVSRKGDLIAEKVIRLLCKEEQANST